MALDKRQLPADPISTAVSPIADQTPDEQPTADHPHANTRRMSRNFIALIVGQVIAKGLAVISNVYLARVLGAEYFGVVTFAMTILTYPELIVNAGFSRLGPREVVRDPKPESVRRLVRAVITIRLALSFVAFAVMALVVVLLPETSDIGKRTIILYGIYFFFVVIDLSWVFLGNEAMHFVSLAEIVMQLVTVIGTLVLIRQPEDLPLVAIIYLSAQLSSIGMLFMLYVRRYGMPGIGTPKAIWQPLAKAALPLAITRSMATVNLNFDSLLVGLVMSSYATGQYGAAYRFIWVPSILIVMYFNAVTPAFDRAHLTGLQSIQALLDRSVRLTGAVGLGIAVAGTILAPEVFNLVFGAEYHDAVLPFQILIWATALLFVNRNFRTLLISFDKQHANLRLTFLSAGTNILLNLVLIPRYGLPGAAFATVAAESINLVLSYLYVHELVGHVPLGRHLPKLGAAGVILASVLFTLLNQPLITQIVVGVVVYAGCVLVLRIVPLEDVLSLVRAWIPHRKAPAEA